MMAAASPGLSENDTSASTVSGPRGEAYVFERPSTSSPEAPGPGISDMNALFVYREQPIGRPRDAVVRPDAVERPLAERGRQRPVVPKLPQPVGQRVGI